MKKFFAILVLGLSCMVMNAQTVELHQSYKNEGSFGSTRLLMEYSWMSEDEGFNFYAWNSYGQDGIQGLLYGEYMFWDNLYLHGEVRAQMGNFDYTTITPQFGLAYLLPIPTKDLEIYLVPKYSYNDVCFSKHDFQFSINSTYSGDHISYDGYIDSNWVKGMSIFAEQKVLYNFNERFSLGVCIVFEANKMYKYDPLIDLIMPNNAHLQPFLVARVSLY